jgi:hypothetical protein
VIDEFRIRQLGLGHGGVLAYQLEKLIPSSSEAEKESPFPPSPPTTNVHRGGDGGNGGNFPDLETATFEDLIEQCEQCRRPLPTQEVYRYSPSGPVCSQCGEESHDDR